jgi:hypothetical protein
VTRAGSLLLSVNPCRPMADAAGVSSLDAIVMARYRARVPARLLSSLPASRRAALSLPPHLYELADDVFGAAVAELAPQVVVLQGASGGGKTEAAKALLQYWLSVRGLEDEGVRPGMLALLLDKRERAAARGKGAAAATAAAAAADFCAVLLRRLGPLALLHSSNNHLRRSNLLGRVPLPLPGSSLLTVGGGGWSLGAGQRAVRCGGWVGREHGR